MIAIKDIGGFFVRRAKHGQAQEICSRETGQQGFTLVEMLVVITIIGLIMGLIGPRVLNYLRRIQGQGCEDSVAKLFRGRARPCSILDAGRFPSTAEGLAALVRQTPGVAAWNGPYLKGGNIPNDPWSHGYVYRSPGEHGPYDIVSYGADGQEGGSGVAADISLENLTSAKKE